MQAIGTSSDWFGTQAVVIEARFLYRKLCKRHLFFLSNFIFYKMRLSQKSYLTVIKSGGASKLNV